MNQARLNKISWSYSQHREELYFYLSFLIWPFGTLVAALKNWRKQISRNVFWLFCVFFGFTFVFAGEGGADSARYADWLVQYAHSDMDLKELWRSLYSDTSGYVDILQPIVTYLVSRFTDNPTILFAVFGLIFGYFYSRNIWYILGKIEGEVTVVLFVLILTFSLINPIWNINGFRMWTAAQIFLYGTLIFLFESKGKGLIWAAVSVFVHFSFILPLSTLILFYFIKNKTNLYLVFFIITSFLKELDLAVVRDSLSFLPGFLQTRVSGYTNLDYAEFRADRQELGNWYIKYSAVGIKWVVYATAISIHLFCLKYLEQRKALLSLFCFSLLLYSFANIFSLVPSGGRIVVVANTFMYAFFVIFFAGFNRTRGINIMKYLIVPFLLLFCIVSLRTGMDYYGLMTLIGNPVLAVIYTEAVPLIEQIKALM